MFAMSQIFPGCIWNPVVCIYCCLCGPFVEQRDKKRWGRGHIYAFSLAYTHRHALSFTLTLKASLNQSIKHLSGFSVWRSACCPRPIINYNRTHTLQPRTHCPTNPILKCHGAVVTERGSPPVTERPNAGLQWLTSLMNFPSLSPRKSAVSELAAILLLLPLLSGARDCSLHPHFFLCVACIYSPTYTHTQAGENTLNTGIQKYLLIEAKVL